MIDGIENDIPVIDKQGTPERVLTDYKVNTISLVDAGALGINAIKLKSENHLEETEKGRKLMAEIIKAKALDNKDKTTPVAKSKGDEPVVEPKADPVDPKADPVEPVDPVVEPEAEPEAEPDVDPAPVEDPKKEDGEPDEDPVDPKVEPEDKSDPDPASAELDEDGNKNKSLNPSKAPEATGDIPEGTPPTPTGPLAVDKSKSFTSTEMISAQVDILKGVHSLISKIHDSIPDAELWEISDMVYSAIWKVEDAIWSAEWSEWSDIYNQIHDEVHAATTKSKALKVAETGTMEDKMKALTLADPAMALIVQDQLDKSKALADAATLEAETAKSEKDAVIRSKALESGASLYKRIGTEDNTTDQIVDALITVEINEPGAFSVISKALGTASTMINSGDLFRDQGSSELAVHVSATDYVEAKSKALVATQEANGEESNAAAARATVRQSAEYAEKFL